MGRDFLLELYFPPLIKSTQKSYMDILHPHLNKLDASKTEQIAPVLQMNPVPTVW